MEKVSAAANLCSFSLEHHRRRIDAAEKRQQLALSKASLRKGNASEPDPAASQQPTLTTKPRKREHPNPGVIAFRPVGSKPNLVFLRYPGLHSLFVLLRRLGSERLYWRKIKREEWKECWTNMKREGGRSVRYLRLFNWSEAETAQDWVISAFPLPGWFESSLECTVRWSVQWLCSYPQDLMSFSQNLALRSGVAPRRHGLYEVDAWEDILVWLDGLSLSGLFGNLSEGCRFIDHARLEIDQARRLSEWSNASGYHALVNDLWQPFTKFFAKAGLRIVNPHPESIDEGDSPGSIRPRVFYLVDQGCETLLREIAVASGFELKEESFK